MSNDVQFNHVQFDGNANITVVFEGVMYVADDQHPLFDEIVEKAKAGDETVVDLFDASRRAAARFENLSDRVTVANSRIYVDQTEVDDAYADLIIRFMDEGDDESWKPLVNFLEKVYSNVSEGIRENLSRWLQAEKFTILPNGNILGYRGLKKDYTSVHAGPGIVNGERVNGHLDNSVGNVVEIDAALVEVDARRGCASGLHVGTFAYASGWSQGALVSVEVDPRHVRSVPYECDSAKMRVSKYTVLADVTEKNTSAVSFDYDVDDYDEWDDEYEDYYF